MLILAPLLSSACGAVDPAVERDAPPTGTLCPPGERALPDGRCQPAGLPADMPCPPGERALPDGRCQPAGLPADMPCPPGEHALPSGGCHRAGVPSDACAAGRFVPDGDGGCMPILPEAACPAGQLAVPGDTVCHEVSPCGEGPWDETIPRTAVVNYVDQMYAGGDSDGSRQRPWKTVNEAVRAAPPGSIVAVAAGRYEEDVALTARPIRLWGLCPARTVLVGTSLSRATISILNMAASGSEVRRLAVTGPSEGILVSRARAVVLDDVWVHESGGAGVRAIALAEVTLRGALIEQSRRAGVLVSGAEATVETTAVRATRPLGDGSFGRGISVEGEPGMGEGGKLRLTNSLIDQNRETGVAVVGSEATVEATVVRATRMNDAGKRGQGIFVQHAPDTGESGKLQLTSSLIDLNHETGVVVIGSEAVVEATVVRATRPNGAGRRGRGITVIANMDTGGKLQLTRSLVDQNHDVGVAVVGSEATIDATVVRATQLTGDGQRVSGILVEGSPDTGERGTLQLLRSLVDQNHDVGVAVHGSDAVVDATVVRATQPSGHGHAGGGIFVATSPFTDGGGKLWLTSSLVDQNHDVGVAVFSSEAAVETTVVRATQPTDDGQRGWGIVAQWEQEEQEKSGSAKLRLTSLLVDQNHGAGVAVFGSEAAVDATVVRATHPTGDGKGGRGIFVQPELQTGHRGKLWLTSSLVDENHEIGVIAIGSEAAVDATVVRATQPNGAGVGGGGVGVQRDPDTGEGGKLWLTNSLVDENHEVGVIVIGSQATVDATVVRATRPNRDGGGGRGVAVQSYLGTGEPGTLQLTSSLVDENHEVGVFVVGSEATVEATVVRATQPNGAGEGGRGFSIQPSQDTGLGGRLSLVTSLVDACHEVGVFVIDSEATIAETLVRATKEAPGARKVGDGILVLTEQGASHAVLTATESIHNARAGVLFVDSTGDLSGVRSTNNRFGLVLQHATTGAQPELGEGNTFEGNSEQDMVFGGNLPIPEARSPVP